MILIPVLVGMTPLNLAQKLSGHCPHSQEKQIQRSSSCLFHSIVPPDVFIVPRLNSSPLERESKPLFHITLENSTRTDIFMLSSPLRC
jgi:hypothetical protein